MLKHSKLEFDYLYAETYQQQLLNNSNLSANFDFKVKDITNLDELNSLDLKISIEEGNISFSNSTIKWKDDLKIKLWTIEQK